MNLTPTLPEARARAALLSDDGLDDVQDVLERLAAGPSRGGRRDLLGRMAMEHLVVGGKKLRARLALAALEALGGRRKDGVAWAAAVEMLHNATLVHDDLQDGDRVRRGRPTVWARHGAAQAINCGDLMLMLPFRALDLLPMDPEVRWQLAGSLAEQAELTVRGQAEELDLLPSGRLDWEAYVAAVEGKTAGLIALPVEGAALLSGRSPREAFALACAFRPVGVLFQMQDDLVDLWGDKGRGPPGSDLREGKVSAVVVAHGALHPEDRPWLLELLRTPREHTTEAMVAEAIRRFEVGGARERVWQAILTLRGRTLHDPALAACQPLRHLAAELIHLALAPVAHLASVCTFDGVSP